MATVGPHRLRLIDTAGLSRAPAPLEKLGMEDAVGRIADADLLVLVVDVTHPSPVPPAGLNLDPSKTVRVLNKSDLLLGPPFPEQAPRFETIPVSALSGAGIDELRQALAREGRRPPVPGRRGLHRDQRASRARAGPGKGLPGRGPAQARSDPQAELLASDLRGALDAFGEAPAASTTRRCSTASLRPSVLGK